MGHTFRATSSSSSLIMLGTWPVPPIKGYRAHCPPGSIGSLKRNYYIIKNLTNYF